MRRDDGLETMLDDQAWTELQEIMVRFRAALRRGDRPAIESYLPADAPHRAVFLAELVHEELEHRLRAGEDVAVGSYLDRFEELRSNSLVARELTEAIAFWRAPGRVSRPGVSVKDDPPLIGRYELGEVIGRGAFGVVHRAYDTTLRRAVALKRPRPGAIETPEAVERFLREARAVAGLRHPGIVPIHDAGQADGELYLVSELVEGHNLADELAVRRPGFPQSAEWVAALAEALEHAHVLGLVHRDVKPSNILIDGEGRVHLTDFGLAKDGGEGATLTMDGQVIGTPAYMAPEQAEGGKGTVDARTDVYGLGVILYELLTGARPFAGTGPMLLARIREEEPRPPRRLDGTIPRDLETICLKCLRKAPGERYSTAGALADDLRRYLDRRPIAARPVPAWERGVKWARRRPAMAALVALCAASALGLIAAWVYEIGRERQYARSTLLAARAHAEELRREAESTRRHLYAVEVGRAYDAWEHSQVELARQTLDAQRPRPGEEDLRGFEWGYLWTLCNRDLVLRGHQGRIADLAFSPDGRILATAGDDHTIRLWETSAWNELATLTGHERAVVDLAFAPDGRELYSGSYDGSLRRWDVPARRADGVLWRGPGAILSLDVAADGHTLAFFGTNPNPRTNLSQLRFLDVATGAVDQHEIGPAQVIWSLAYAPDGRSLAGPGDPDHQVRLWDTNRRRIQAVLTGHTQAIYHVRFSPDGHFLATSSLDGTVRIWDPATGREVARQSRSPNSTALAYSPDGRILAFADIGEIRLWDPTSNGVRTIRTPQLGRIYAMAFSPDQRILATGGSDGTVRLWEHRTARPLPATTGRQAEKTLAEPPQPDMIRFDPSGENPNCVEVSPDGRSLAVGHIDGSALILDSRTGAVRVRLPRNEAPYRDLLYWPDGRTVAAAIVNTYIPIYDTTTGLRRGFLSERGQPGRPVWSLALTPDARSLIAGTGIQGEPGKALIWDLATGELRMVLRGHADYVRSVAFAPGGRILATASGDETVKLWDLASGHELATLHGHRGQVFCVAHDPAGHSLASGSEDQTVRIWDVAARCEVATLRGHVAPVHSVGFSPDGTRLASAGRDGSIFLWDVATRRRIGDLRGHSQRVNELQFFPDGRALVSASVDRTIRFWRGDPAGR